MHRHVHDYMFINLVQSETRGLDQKLQYATPISLQQAEQITYVSLQQQQQAIHAAENVGKDTFRQVIIEFKQ